jgi:hypothetical protein
MMDGLAAPYEWQEHDATSAKFTDIYRTTWEELISGRMVKARTFDRYELTAAGWLAGLKVTGQFEDPGFRKTAGHISAKLKAKVGGRTGWGFTDRTTLARETGLSEFIIYDVIDSHLLREMFGQIDATWAVDDQMKNDIDVPPNFGESCLSP